ncbi:hypothetical protein PIB30_068097 [Stylosanthes scabra]|uniref:Secreted protein n=1 Tax=Stylosanthes scabra TaxID=79078 RepID=A0ABU6TNQ4_9FABA|nr:hypothetical protein [Stylosanthes scabra]
MVLGIVWCGAISVGCGEQSRAESGDPRPASESLAFPAVEGFVVEWIRRAWRLTSDMCTVEQSMCLNCNPNSLSNEFQLNQFHNSHHGCSHMNLQHGIPFACYAANNPTLYN